MTKTEAIQWLEEISSLLLQAEDKIARVRQNSEIDVDDLETSIQMVVMDTQVRIDELNGIDPETGESDDIEIAIGDDYQVVHYYTKKQED